MMGGDLREAADLPFSGNRVTFVYTEPDSAYSVVEWVAAPGAPGTPLHLHRATDEAFYVLEGTLGFQVGQRTLELRACLVRVRVKPFWRSGVCGGPICDSSLR
jgi:quercetin dioxygenase-like cupin family protein